MDPIYTYYRRVYSIQALDRAIQAYQARLFVRLVGANVIDCAMPRE
jgi:hypothetical protein